MMIQDEQVVAWLRKRVYRQSLLNLLGGLLALVSGALVVTVTYWMTYGSLWWIFLLYEPVWEYLSWISGVFVAYLFIAHWRADREELNEFSVTTGTYNDELVTFYVPELSMLTNINPLAPDTAHSIVKVFVNMLLIGPRVVVAGFRMLYRSFQLLRIDIRCCASVIALLFEHEGRVPFQNVLNRTPLPRPARVFEQLGLIDGVIFLKKKPEGVMLSSELRHDIERAEL